MKDRDQNDQAHDFDLIFRMFLIITKLSQLWDQVGDQEKVERQWYISVKTIYQNISDDQTLKILT